MEEERRGSGGRGGSLTPLPLCLPCCQVLIPTKPQPHQRTPKLQKRSPGQHPVGCEQVPATNSLFTAVCPTYTQALPPAHHFIPKKTHSSRFLPQPTPAKDASSSCTARGNPQPAACHPRQAPGHFCIPTGPQPHREFNLPRSLAHHPTKGTTALQSSPFTTGLAEMALGRGWEEKCEQCGCRRAKRRLLLGRAPCPPSLGARRGLAVLLPSRRLNLQAREPGCQQLPAGSLLSSSPFAPATGTQGGKCRGGEVLEVLLLRCLPS